ncbi:MAG: hypothetical protein ACK56I_26855, partial [bacterium]
RGVVRGRCGLRRRWLPERERLLLRIDALGLVAVERLSEPRDLEVLELALLTKLLDLRAHLVELLLHRGHLPAQHRDDVQQLLFHARFNAGVVPKIPGELRFF